MITSIQGVKNVQALPPIFWVATPFPSAGRRAP